MAPAADLRHYPVIPTFRVRYTRRVLKATEKEIIQGSQQRLGRVTVTVSERPYILYGQTRTTRLRERADDRASEPYYLLRPTMHGPGGTLLITAHSFLERRSLKIQLGPKRGFEGDRCNDNFLSWRYFESVIKGPPALAEDSGLTPIPVWRILVLFSSREGSERAVKAQWIPSYCILWFVYSYGQTLGLSPWSHLRTVI